MTWKWTEPDGQVVTVDKNVRDDRLIAELDRLEEEELDWLGVKLNQTPAVDRDKLIQWMHEYRHARLILAAKKRDARKIKEIAGKDVALYQLVVDEFCRKHPGNVKGERALPEILKTKYACAWRDVKRLQPIIKERLGVKLSENDRIQIAMKRWDLDPNLTPQFINFKKNHGDMIPDPDRD